jgi:hypothetical protein
MSNVPLFIAGIFISLLVAFAVGLMFYAAVLDGRSEDEHRDARGAGEDG